MNTAKQVIVNGSAHLGTPSKALEGLPLFEGGDMTPLESLALVALAYATCLAAFVLMVALAWVVQRGVRWWRGWKGKEQT